MTRALSGLCLAVAAFCLALGITLPLLEMERLFFLTDRPSPLDVMLVALASAIGAYLAQRLRQPEPRDGP